jgi:hypothetical protein
MNMYVRFMIISRWIILIIKTFQTLVVKNSKTHILCSITFYENRAVYDTMWKNLVGPDRRRMSI